MLVSAGGEARQLRGLRRLQPPASRRRPAGDPSPPAASASPSAPPFRPASSPASAATPTPTVVAEVGDDDGGMDPRSLAVALCGSAAVLVCLILWVFRFRKSGRPPYSVGTPLGHGCGRAFRAVRQRDGSELALKWMEVQSEQELAAVMADVEALRELEHPSVVPVLDVLVRWPGEPALGDTAPCGGLQSGQLSGHLSSGQLSGAGTGLGIAATARAVAIVMPYYRDGDLKTFILSHKELVPYGTVWHVAREVCAALRYLHSNKPCVVHRDLKPENILLSGADWATIRQSPHRTTRPRVVLTDVGFTNGRAEQTHCHTRTGSLPFVAPEVWQQAPTEKADMWALGCVVYAMVTERICDHFSTRVMYSDVKKPTFKDDIRADIECSEAQRRVVGRAADVTTGRVVELVLALLDASPARRWSSTRAHGFLTAVRAAEADPPNTPPRTRARALHIGDDGRWPEYIPAVPSSSLLAASVPATPEPAAHVSHGSNVSGSGTEYNYAAHVAWRRSLGGAQDLVGASLESDCTTEAGAPLKYGGSARAP